MRAVLAAAIACLTLGSWHWQPLVPPKTAVSAAAREIYTGPLTLDGGGAAFKRVIPATTL
jgi:hypothetical protein